MTPSPTHQPPPRHPTNVASPSPETRNGSQWLKPTVEGAGLRAAKCQAPPSLRVLVLECGIPSQRKQGSEKGNEKRASCSIAAMIRPFSLVSFRCPALAAVASSHLSGLGATHHYASPQDTTCLEQHSNEKAQMHVRAERMRGEVEKQMEKRKREMHTGTPKRDTRVARAPTWPNSVRHGGHRARGSVPKKVPTLRTVSQPTPTLHGKANNQNYIDYFVGAQSSSKVYYGTSDGGRSCRELAKPAAQRNSAAAV